MAKHLEIYKCEVCGIIVEAVHCGDGTMVCCDQPMTKLEARTEDKGQEKHVPVVEKTDRGIKVTVGSVEHPMEQEHYIEWIEVISGDTACRQFLHPGGKPTATFCCGDVGNITVREHCNVHGLWKKS